MEDSSVGSRRSVSKFFQRGKINEPPAEEAQDEVKKRPWYNGALTHKLLAIRSQLESTIFNSWINILLIVTPVGIALNYAGFDKRVVFAVNFLAIIPLAAVLGFATEEIALHIGESLGGLLNASFG